MEERQDDDRVSLSIHPIEDHEWGLGDPRLVDALLLDLPA
jgi:hypothetical protein